MAPGHDLKGPGAAAVDLLSADLRAADYGEEQGAQVVALDGGLKGRRNQTTVMQTAAPDYRLVGETSRQGQKWLPMAITALERL